MTQAYMREKLMCWNPRWNPATVEGWSLAQLTSVFHKERIRVVKAVLAFERTKSIS